MISRLNHSLPQMLYNYSSTENHLLLSQAALLLTHGCPDVIPDQGKPTNTAWLQVAIGHARAISADAYDDANSEEGETTRDEEVYHDSLCLKRLWWCCIIRDRIITLCFRQPIQICQADFDFVKKNPLGLADLKGDMDGVEAYSVQSKNVIVSITTLLAELCVRLTDTHELVYGYSGEDALSNAYGNVSKRIGASKIHLRNWYKTASLTLSGWEDEIPGIPEEQRNMISLWTNLLWVYYE